MSKTFTNITITIHPTPILNISEFYNRMRVNYKSERVFGGLIGEQHGNKIELYAIFEFLNNKVIGDDVDLDLEFLDSRRKIAEQLYPNYDFVGFFSTNNINDSPNSLDAKVYDVLKKQGVCSPINLVLCSELADKKVLPLKAYFYNETQKEFVSMPLEINGYESERICLDTVTKDGGAQFNDSKLVQNTETLKSALLMLKSNLSSVLELVKDENLRKNPKFVELVDDLMKNYPSSSNNADLQNFLKSSLDEMLVISNVASSSIGISLSKNS